MANTGNSNILAREYIDSLFIETRYMDAVIPSTEFTLFGERFASPIMTAALSHLGHFMFEGASLALAKGAKEANAVMWYGMAEAEEIEALAGTGARMIEIIKPYIDRNEIYKKIEHAEKTGLLAVGIDIDHAFGQDGANDDVFGNEMKALSTAELTEICASTRLPLIVKGVLSAWDAERALKAGASGLMVSHHNNRIEYAVPPYAMLPEIVDMAGSVPVFVEDEVKTGMDAFKALALGAKGVCIGRPLMTAIKNDKENGVRDYLIKANTELKKAMAFTGSADLNSIDGAVLHRV